AGEEARADLTMIEGRRLHGLVVDADTKEPIVGLMVGCYGPANPQSGAAVESATTNDQGHFELFVPPGPAFVYLMDPKYMGRSSQRRLTVPEGEDPEPVRFEASTGMDRGMTAMAKAEYVPAAAPLVVPKGGGRTLSGRVTDPDGRPVPGVSVGFRPQDGGRFVSAATDRDGVYLLKGLPEGKIQLGVSHADLTPQAEKDIGADQNKVDFVVTRPAPKPLVSKPPVPEVTIPPDLREKLTFVDLQPLANDRLDDGPGGYGNDLAEVPRGVQRLANSYFKIGSKMIPLRGEHEPGLPEKIQGTKVGARCAKLHILHATQWGEPIGTEVGTYVLNYSDGTVARIPIVYGENVCNWWDFKGQDFPKNAVIAWHGSNESVALSNLFIRL